MNKDDIIQTLMKQLELATRNNSELTQRIQECMATIESLRLTISSLEKALTEKNAALGTAANKLRGVTKLLGNKSEKQNAPATVKAEASQNSSSVVTSYNPKDRGNNGARRNMHYELKTVEKDVFPSDPCFDAAKARLIGERDSVIYSFTPITFTKTVYHLHNYNQDGKVHSCQAPLTPLFNSSYDSTFIAGIAQLRYMYSMPVERIVSYFQENGFDISKATANGLLQKTARLCENLYASLHDTICP